MEAFWSLRHLLVSGHSLLKLTPGERWREEVKEEKVFSTYDLSSAAFLGKIRNKNHSLVTLKWENSARVLEEV